METGAEVVSGPGWGYTFSGNGANHARLDDHDGVAGVLEDFFA